MSKTKAIIGIAIVVFFVSIIVLNTATKPSVPGNTELLGGRTIEQVEADIASRSAQWAAEQPYAARGRIAQETMKVLNRQNLLDRELLNLVRPLTPSLQANAKN